MFQIYFITIKLLLKKTILFLYHLEAHIIHKRLIYYGKTKLVLYFITVNKLF